MKYVRIEETRRIAVEKAMTKALEEARAYVYCVESMELTKDDCNCLINDFFGNIVHIIEENDLAEVAVEVWNKDTVNPANIDRKLIDVMWDYRAENYFIIKKKTRRDQIINRLYRLCDYLDVLLITADRTGEMEEERRAEIMKEVEKNIEAERIEDEKFDSMCETKTETVIIGGKEYTRTYKVLKEETEETQETETQETEKQETEEPITNYDEEKNVYNHETGEKIEETEDEWEVPEEFYRQEEEANKQVLEAARNNALQVMKERGELEEDSGFKPIEIDFPNGKYIQVWKTSDGYECNEFNEDGEKISHTVYGHLEDIDLDYGTSLWRKE